MKSRENNVMELRKPDVNYSICTITPDNFDWNKIIEFTGNQFPLHYLAVHKNFKKIIEIFMTKKVTKLQINQIDDFGNTVLLLSSKLCRQDP